MGFDHCDLIGCTLGRWVRQKADDLGLILKLHSASSRVGIAVVVKTTGLVFLIYRPMTRVSVVGGGDTLVEGPAKRLAAPALTGSTDIELDTLGEWQGAAEIDRVGRPPHIGLPGIRAGLAPAARFLFATKGTADFGA